MYYIPGIEKGPESSISPSHSTFRGRLRTREASTASPDAPQFALATIARPREHRAQPTDAIPPVPPPSRASLRDARACIERVRAVG